MLPCFRIRLNLLLIVILIYEDLQWIGELLSHLTKVRRLVEGTYN